MSPEARARWRETELRILGGIVHEMNGALGGITLATELSRMDDELPGDTLDVLEQQSRRLQQEFDTLSALIALERSALQLHDPFDLADSAVRLYTRMSAKAPAAVRILPTSRVVAVEVADGPCIRALVLCMRAFGESFAPGNAREVELHMDRIGNEVSVLVRAGNPAHTPLPDLLDAARSMLTGASGARLEDASLMMQTPG